MQKKQQESHIDMVSEMIQNRKNNDSETLVSDKKLKEHSFNMVVDSVPYFIKAVPFSFNDDIRFYISINGGTDHVFTWDPQVLGMRAIDDKAGDLPTSLEEAISRKIQSKQVEFRVR